MLIYALDETVFGLLFCAIVGLLLMPLLYEESEVICDLEIGNRLDDACDDDGGGRESLDSVLSVLFWSIDSVLIGGLPLKNKNYFFTIVICFILFQQKKKKTH